MKINVVLNTSLSVIGAEEDGIVYHDRNSRNNELYESGEKNKVALLSNQ
jgi:hypothetical protein